MTKQEMYQPIIEAIIDFGEEHGLIRLKVETPHFDFVFERDEAGTFQLVTTKAVVRAVGKVTKVRLQGGDTYEAAYERVRQHWSDYFKRYRQGQPSTEDTKAKNRVRAKRYRSNKRAEEQAFLERG